MKFPTVDLSQYAGITAGVDVEISCRELVVVGSARLGARVRIEADRVVLGDGAEIGRDVEVRGLGAPMVRFEMGDESFLGHSNQVLLPEFFLGDYSQIHHSGLMSGYAPLTLGHNCWVGQQSILNATEQLLLGNNVRIGTHSQLWTHIASGELLEGSLLFGQKPLTLEDDVWIVGGAVVSPGLTLARKTVILAGSVVTRSTEAESVYGGSPARSMGDKVKAWKSMDLDSKWVALKQFSEEYCTQYPGDRSFISFLDLDVPLDAARLEAEISRPGALVLIKKAPKAANWAHAQATVFDLNTKQYNKRRSLLEKRWIRFHVGYRARFLPTSDS